MDHPKPYVITIVGPESSGKTTLARELAAKYDCPWVPEFAREYLEGLGREYDLEDLFLIAERQLSIINQQLTLSGQMMISESSVVDSRMPGSRVPHSSHLNQEGFDSINKYWLGFYREYFGDTPRPLVIIDGGMLTLRVWARIKFGMSIPMVDEALSKDMTSLYILCRPVFSWEPDPLREAPSILDRSWIYNQYLKELVTIPSK